MTTKQKIQYIANHYGYEPQSRQLIEEMAELTVAINKGWRKNHPVQVLQPTELGRGGDADGTKVYSKQFKNGV